MWLWSSYFLRGMILQDRKRLFFSEWKITNQSLEWLGYSWCIFVCLLSSPNICRCKQETSESLVCFRHVHPPLLEWPNELLRFLRRWHKSRRLFMRSQINDIYIYSLYIVLITCPISCTLPSGTTLTVASYHICGKHAFERCVFSIIILIKGFPLPPFPLNASASLQTKEDLGSCAGEKCAAEMHMAISTSRWHPKTNRSTCAMVTTWLVSLKGE